MPNGKLDVGDVVPDVVGEVVVGVVEVVRVDRVTTVGFRPKLESVTTVGAELVVRLLEVVVRLLELARLLLVVVD